jgi:lipopolysaccharide transport system permease protein
VLVRYKQAALGISWAVLQPVLTMVVFGVIFGKLAGLPSDGQPYAVFVFVALLPWQLFAGGLQRSGASLVNNANLLTKVYFPRLVIPLSAIFAGLVDFAISLCVLVVLMIAYGIVPTINVLWLPLFVLLALATALAVGLWASALNVLYRDVGYMLPFLVQVWMYASPVAYSANLVPSGPWRVVYAVNPMVGVIQAFRWALLGGPAPGGWVLVSVAVVVVLLVSGLVYFRRMERRFADVV